MRVLLDESIPADFAQELTGVDAVTVGQLGWAGLKNGVLLRRAEAEFAVLVTMDRNLQYQQNLAARAIGVVLVRAVSNRMVDLRPLVPQILRAVASVGRGEIRVVGA